MTENKTFNKVATFFIMEFEDGYEHRIYTVSDEEYKAQYDRLIFEHGFIKHVYLSVEPINEGSN